LEKTLNAEMDEHLGHEKHGDSQNGNYRNGFSKKTVKGLFGQTEIKTPRDRGGAFEPIIVAKNQSNISRIEQAIIMQYAKGTSTRDIVEFIKETYKFNLDPSSVSRITDKILPDIQEFQNRPLSETYAVVFIDGIRFKIREEGFSKEVSVYIPLGINLEGKKEVFRLLNRRIRDF
jgi:transposase-like protein